MKRGDITDDDLRLLDTFRRSFSPAYEQVVATIRQLRGATIRSARLVPTGRPAKSTSSIIEKLRRETTRLTQMQDIAGCRLVLPGIRAQEKAVGALTKAFARAVVVDRRQSPSHGYRAVHMIVKVAGDKPIEIQVRTTLQHLWAEFSEKLADVIDPAIKYGGGPERMRRLLAEYSSLVGQVEAIESKKGAGPTVADLKARVRRLLRGARDAFSN